MIRDIYQRVRYDDCSNGALIFDPATGTNVNNGVLTVTTTENLDGMTWQNCGRIATNGARGIAKDYTMIVCPDVVNFGGAAAWGQMPGSITWYMSRYASAPIVQMHELGHNLGHHHSGKDGVTYKDPTCNMGNGGSWSDRGSNFCFNAAKTWANKWYEEYHATVDPSSGGYDGTLVGINAVKKDGTIAATGQDVVIKVDSPGEIDLYIIYNRKTGANNQVPENGDEVVIVEQSRELRETSSWRAALSEGEEYTQGGWSSAGSLIVKVCSLEKGTPGSARVLVYATGQETLSCNAAPVNAPNNAPENAPARAPVSAPTKDDSCEDSLLNFIYKNTIERNCEWIGKNSLVTIRIGRCQDPAAAKNCPLTCGNCPQIIKISKDDIFVRHNLE